MPIDPKRLAPVTTTVQARTTYSLKTASGDAITTNTNDYLKAKY